MEFGLFVVENNCALFIWFQSSDYDKLVSLHAHSRARGEVMVDMRE